MYIPFSDLAKSLATDWQNFACRAVGAVNAHFAQHIYLEGTSHVFHDQECFKFNCLI